MKKKLIAIAVATASVMSGVGVANAESGWQTAGTGGRIDIGGTITVENIYDDLWQWKLGDAIDLANTASDMTNENKTLTVTMTDRKPLLVGKSETFKTAAAGMGASPSISFTDADGDKVELETPDSSSNGEARLTLPIKDKEQSTIGSLELNVTALGIMYSQAYINASYSAPHKMVAPNEGDIFHGGLPSKINAGGGSSSHANKIAADGGWSINDMKTKYDAHTGTSRPWASSNNSYRSTGTERDGIYTYSMAIDAGQQLVANFTSPVTTTTQWSAPLNIAITYN
ncbi:hypothetical protein [Cronobacter turicensis]|uniref:F4 family fimbrial subunit n=1 Tax=Cronobacter turicensis TaxID=413502 RepID=UPI0024C395CF|nr:hypothetical protein [Cronobacter turicensis]MDK1186948.1 hypothetical protein [Cronobacter turicensis]MDK1207818.1 hypothetical protein [Cronobacter turicensis]MDK1216763.1 hypothetical protein [Cronobacter turicensis]MDK1220639.1 hypothetical protein [Cronobacter turicensis]MDK1233851.1 hypothetical protein [Cronobacter turicensis]